MYLLCTCKARTPKQSKEIEVELRGQQAGRHYCRYMLSTSPALQLPWDGGYYYVPVPPAPFRWLDEARMAGQGANRANRCFPAVSALPKTHSTPRHNSAWGSQRACARRLQTTEHQPPPACNRKCILLPVLLCLLPSLGGVAMDEYTPDAIVNRDEPVPVLSPSQHDSSKRRPAQPTAGHKRSPSLQDRLLTKLLEQVIPADNVNDHAVSVGDKPIPTDPKRPAFSLPLMANNFRRFNARIGVVFHFQTQVERLLSWKKPSHTFSFLFVYSFVCLDPHLLVILPLACFLLFVMVPAFLARHPPPPSTSTSSITPYYSYQGPALAPAKTIKPASETSKDFFRNMRDLQNCMADFSDVHDATVSVFAPLTNFSNEKLSSSIFLLCMFVTALMFLTAHLMPWRLILLFGGNVVILSSHPQLQELFKSIAADLAGEAVPKEIAQKEQVSDMLGLPSSPSAAMSLMGSLADISLDTYAEEREVEIFEIQYRSLAPYSESQWDHFLFSSMPYDPLSPSRIAGDRPKGCRFFEDVQPPQGWAWKSKKWELDLDCREWVVERMITGVGFEVSGEAAEGGSGNDEIGGWVWDLPSTALASDEMGVADALGYQDLDTPSKSTKKKGKGRTSQDFEEKGGIGANVMGEWRRRRWVRVVHRISMPAESDKEPTDDERD